ncbi:MAG: VWA domain-containing protein [Planctomycetes bacterium]|nr:VWA domain-containing protein [Planctomycetota bacterium]
MFLNPLGLLALLAVPAVVALHLFRRRFQPKRVSALFLWEARTTTALSGRRRDRVLRSPSFWAEVLLALLLALALAGPRACSGLAARHLVVVLDGSASMSARPQGADGRAEASFAERAVDEVDARIAALPGGSRVTLVLSGARPTILCGPAAFPQEARAALDGYPALASAGRHDLEPATSLALQLAGAGAVTVVTDRFEPERFPERVGVVALGRPLENLAITRATRLAESDAGPGAERVLLTVANLAERPRVRPRCGSRPATRRWRRRRSSSSRAAAGTSPSTCRPARRP